MNKGDRLLGQLELFASLFKKAKGKGMVTQLEASRILGVQPSTVGNYRERGLLHDLSEGVGRSRFYALSEVKKLKRPKMRPKMGRPVGKKAK